MTRESIQYTSPRPFSGFARSAWREAYVIGSPGGLSRILRLVKKRNLPSGERMGQFSLALELISLPMWTAGLQRPSRRRKLTYKSPAPRPSSRTPEEKIRKLFKQNIFNYDLPVHSIIRQDLFSAKTWQVLGLSPKQLITTAGLAGGSVGAAIDLAAAGLTFGIFTAIGGAIGAGWAALGGGKKLAKVKLSGLKLGGQQIKMGPNENIQFLYILIDRALIFYSHIINWAHGRRDYPVSSDKRQSEPAKESFTLKWDDDEKRICQNFFKAIFKGDENRKEIALQELKEVLKDKLNNISHSEERSTDD